MSDLPTYPKLPEKKIEDPVARSIAKPHAFAKPGNMTTTTNKGTRFRPLAFKKGPGRMRKRKRDPRQVDFY